MFATRYRAIINHLEQAIAILGAPDPANAEVTASIRNTIALLEEKIAIEKSLIWSEDHSDFNIVQFGNGTKFASRD